jgi:hypothetical protein
MRDESSLAWTGLLGVLGCRAIVGATPRRRRGGQNLHIDFQRRRETTPFDIGTDYVAGLARHVDGVELVQVFRLLKP